MLRKFVHGLMFGAGFGIAFIAVWIIGTAAILPKVIVGLRNEPKFENPSPARLANAEKVAPPSPREFSFFKDSHNRMAIPTGGGILSMSTMATEPGAKRPNTYQLWLTQKELWQIRTTGEKAEIEKLPYPEGASVESLDTLMFQNLGMDAMQSTTTVSPEEIGLIKSQRSWRNDTLNGQMCVTEEGVVFVLPNPYET